ncbi:MAG TPA: FkbM family methyltransferase [Burkholderiales bacterium]|nr:FkbM family methyltransferase [Burkholderiales bacterium]
MSILGSLLRRTISDLRDPDRYLNRASGVIHVGANTGQERIRYARRGLRVVWIEPIPEVFATLQENIRPFPLQTAFQYLMTDRDDSEYAFHIASNAGKSASILALKLHKDVYPAVAYERSVAMRSITLAPFLEREKIAAGDYDALIMDVQGAELLVLKGAGPILGALKFIKTEVADFESYAGCCQLKDIEAFVAQFGFREIVRHKFAERPQGGSYYDVLYERKA